MHYRKHRRDIHQLEEQLKRTAHKAASAQDDDLRAEIEKIYKQEKQQLGTLKQQLAAIPSNSSPPADPEQQATQALVLLDQIQCLAADPGAQQHLPELSKKLNLRVGLFFKEEQRASTVSSAALPAAS